MNSYKHTKIVATISPAVATKDSLTEFINSGVNVFRLNFSHGSHEEYTAMINTIKEVRSEKQVNVAILQDLQGPRVRVTALSEPLTIEVGDEVFLTYDKRTYDLASDAKVLPLDHDLVPILEAGDSILIEDGLIELTVKEILLDEQYAVCEAKTNSTIKGRKGVNFPGSSTDFPVITDKDKQDLAFGLSQGVDILAMSFVRSRQDIENLRALIEADSNKSHTPLVIAKIEKPDAVDAIEDILEVVDGVMIARGDLAIETPAEKVPVIQKQIIELCLLKGKRVIVATQMLDSMIRNPRPTRAEVSDVANAVIDHTDAVMLSGETSGGLYPLQAIEMMKRIILATEESDLNDYYDEFYQFDDAKNVYRELAYGAQHLARQSEADGIVIFDPEGKGVAEYISEFRPEVPVFVLTTNKEYFHKTALTWGVTGVYRENLGQSNDSHHILTEIKSTYFPEHSGDSQYFVVVDISKSNQQSIQMFML